MSAIEVLEKLHDFISKPVLFGVFGIICVLFAIASLVLVFHWSKYAIDKSSVVTAQSIFFLGGALILLIGFISVVLY